MVFLFIPFLLQTSLAVPTVELLPRLETYAAVAPNWVRGSTFPTLMWMERGKAKTMKLQQSVFRESAWTKQQTKATSKNAFINWADFPQAAVSEQGESLYALLENLDYPGFSYGVRMVTHQTDSNWLHQDMSGVEHGFPSVVAHPEGGWLAVWLDGRGGNGHGGGPAGEKMSFMATRVSPKGVAGNEILIDGRTCSCCSTDLAFTKDGNAWAVYRDRDQEEIRDIALVQIPATFDQALDSSNTKLQPRIPVADGWKIPGCPVNGPALAVHENQLAYSWFTMGKQGNQPQVRLAFSCDGGAVFSTPLRVDSGHSLGRVDLEFVDSNAVLVTWLETQGRGAVWMAKVLNIQTGETSPAIPLGAVSGSRTDGFLRLFKHQSQIYAAWLDGEAIRTARITVPVADQPTVNAVVPEFETSDSLLKQRVHNLKLDGTDYEVEILKVGDVRVKVKRISDQKEFEIPLSMLSRKQRILITEWQAYNELYDPKGLIETEFLTASSKVDKDTIIADIDGYEISTMNIPLMETVLKVQFKYTHARRAQAKRLMNLMKHALVDYEAMTGVPFPGLNPYEILEIPGYENLGLAGPTDMWLCGLDKAGEWVLAHEAVHIWNSGGGPGWVGEGLADYVGYLEMIKYDGVFLEVELREDYVDFWNEFKNTDEDYPLSEKKYDYTYGATKSMIFWELMNEKYGDEFIYACFTHNSTKSKLTNDNFRELLKKFGEKDPERIMSGWLVKGDYRFE